MNNCYISIPKGKRYGAKKQFQAKGHSIRNSATVPIMARAKREDKTAFMSYDKLIIDRKEYKPPVNKTHTCTKQRTNNRVTRDD